ncbi:MAG: sialidase family protein [Saprospiraceae bacterium]
MTKHFKFSFKYLGNSLLCRVMFLIMALFVFQACSKKNIVYNSVNKELTGPFKNIKIHQNSVGSGPCEPSISINPRDVNKIVAGSVLNNVYTSKDGGKTWAKSVLSSSQGVYGDPVIRHDFKGNVYYSHLANPKNKAYGSVEFLDKIVVQSSSDNGKSWTDGTFPQVDHLKDHDKQWLAMHPETGEIAMTWTEFDKYGSEDTIHKSRILFSKSSDQGRSWTKSVTINEWEGDCLDNDYTTEGAHPAFGINGEIYVVWCFDEKIWMDVSEDGGKTWGKDRVIGQQKGGWAFDIPGIRRSNGFPTIKVDYTSNGGKGNIYVQWSDQRNGQDNTDIFMIRSTDRGKTWSKEITVNDDNSKRQQFYSWMDVDQATGYLYLVFYDRRNHDDDQTDVYLAYSTDQGKTFKNVKVSESPFVPIRNVFFGDYNDISVENGVIRPIWTRQEGQELSVLTAIIQHK